MSRIGKKPIVLPDGVKLSCKNNDVLVEGKKGKLNYVLPACIGLASKDGTVELSVTKVEKNANAYHGLARSLVANMIEGVSSGYNKTLIIKGVGYRAAVKANTLNLILGYSHPIEIDFPKDIEIKVEKNTTVHIAGIDKHKVGHFAAVIRRQRPLEPYKGKGIRYSDERVILKAGKSAGK